MTGIEATSGQTGSRRRNLRGLLAIAIIGWAAAGVIAADRSPRSLVAEANESIVAGDLSRAMKLLQEAASLKPDAPEIAYDLGVAHYKAGDYATAAEYFLKALTGSNLGLEQKTRFNLGNCAYSEGLKKKDDPKAALEKFKIAADRFREALHLDPQDGDARANLERSGLMIRQMKEEQQKKEQEQQKQNNQQSSQPESQPSSQPENKSDSKPSSQPGDQQQKQGQEKQGQKQQGEQKQGEEQQGEEQKSDNKEGEKKDGKPHAAEEKKGEQGQEQQAQPAASQRSMNKDEAERLLQLIRDKERQRREGLYNENQKGHTRDVPVDKDW